MKSINPTQEPTMKKFYIHVEVNYRGQKVWKNAAGPLNPKGAARVLVRLRSRNPETNYRTADRPA
jgi:hypothetical protein